MILVFFGPPGSGKGTQAQLLSEKLHFDYIATGNLLRGEIAQKTDLGRRIELCMGEGKFPSDDIIMDVFRHALEERNHTNLLLDGVPRTLNQAKLLDEVFQEKQLSVGKVFAFNLDDSVLKDRILGRFVCKDCSATYHHSMHPPKIEGVCDYCGSKNFIQRKDDQEDALKKRLELYYLETLPVLEYYNSKGIVVSVDAAKSPDEVSQQIMSIIEKADKGE